MYFECMFSWNIATITNLGAQSSAPKLLSLPNELIIRIANELETCKIFRATCRQINLALAPHLLSRIVIDVTPRRIDVSISQLEALAAGSTSAGEYVRTINIQCLSPLRSLGVPSYELYSFPIGGSRFDGRDPDRSRMNWARARVVELLPAALSTLKRAETLIWNINGGDLDGALDPIFARLLPPSPTITITASLGISNPQLNHALNLTKLTVTDYLKKCWIAKIIGASPNLTHLDLLSSPCYFGEHTPTLHGVLSSVPRGRPLRLQHLGISGYCVRLCQEVLSHLRFLESLELHAVPHIKDEERSDYTGKEIVKSDGFSSPMGDIWNAVARECNHIHSVTAPVDDSLLGYLAATDDIKNLTLLGADIDARAENFFIHILPRYAKTLVSLGIFATYEGLWCFGTHNIDVLLQCTNLVELSIAVNTCGGHRAPVANTVAQILNMTTSLPNLRQLGLLPARPEKFRGVPYSEGASRAHSRIVVTELWGLVTAFAPVDPAIHPPVIMVVEHVVKEFCIGRCDGSIRYVEQP
ncbi:hypothetical protein BD779DRAFT_518975 [Infundibulicybe gibba]|nr:hypothetical protein BD779DRAFT_518975 [Infundibulicybe gibba]